MKFDPRAAWASLSPAQQQAIGEAALLLHVATEAQAINCENANPSPEVLAADRLWEEAEQAAWQRLTEVVPMDADLFDEGPDLTGLLSPIRDRTP